MTSGITFNIEISKALRKLESIPKQARSALTAAMNRAATAARAEAAREMRSAGFEFKIATLKNFLKIEKAIASGDELAVAIRAKGKSIPLIKFRVYPPPRPKGAGYQRPAVGIYATILGKTYGGRDVFYATVTSGHVGIFRRVGPSRLPITQVFGPTIADALATADVVEAAKRVFFERYGVVLKQQIARFTGA